MTLCCPASAQTVRPPAIGEPARSSLSEPGLTPADGPLRVALISLHTSPLARAGVGDAGGM
ncbi:MAG: hypothetical protein LBH68_08690, partial [Bifidobacteriaceae bacterium]|nr:hypothetical protein [Bifidobacteriaceae bacterium]